MRIKHFHLKKAKNGRILIKWHRQTKLGWILFTYQLQILGIICKYNFDPSQVRQRKAFFSEEIYPEKKTKKRGGKSAVVT